MENTNGSDNSRSDIANWLACVGYLLPETDEEYTRFKKLFPNAMVSSTSMSINPTDILKGNSYTPKQKKGKTIDLNVDQEYKLVASKKKNQSGKNAK